MSGAGSRNWDSYLNAEVVIDAPDNRVLVVPTAGKCTGPFPFSGGPMHVLTASNPMGDARPALANRVSDVHLRSDLVARELAFSMAWGADTSWSHVETSVAVLGLSDDEAVALGQSYQQEAIFRWSPDAWALLSCIGSDVMVTGFRSTVVEVSSRSTPLPRALGRDALLQLARAEGASDEVAALVADLGIDPLLISGPLDRARGFLSAAAHQDLDVGLLETYLLVGRGDPENSWQAWGDDAAEDEES